MFGDSTEVIDLSNPLTNDAPVWPTLSALDASQTAWAARDGATMEDISTTSHAGTHVDAPLHFIPEGETLDDFPIKKFMGEGLVVDLTPIKPETAIGQPALERFDDLIQPGDVVMLHTGWDKYHGRTQEYLFEFPHLSKEAAKYLASKKPKAVGIDTLSVGGREGEVPAHGPTANVGADESHLPLLENNILPIEELRNLGSVLQEDEARRAMFVYLPINYYETSGASARAIALL